MALLHRATVRPSKLELLSDWLPGRAWCPAPAGEPHRIAAYRFDDPAGAVGIETMLVRFGDGPVLQVPLTYRDAPLAGGDDRLLGTAEHSVLGKRWIYDAAGDPVYAAALAAAILGGTGQADEFTETDSGLERREPSMTVTSAVTGDVRVPAVGAVVRVADDDPTVIVTGTVELRLARRVDADPGFTGAVLTGVWPGQRTPVALAAADY